MRRVQFSTLLILFLGFLGLGPLLFMLGSTLFDAEGFSLHAYASLIGNASLWKSFGNSLILSLGVATATTIFGTMLALLLTKTRLAFRFLWLMLFLIPLLIPPYILAYGCYASLGREGVLGELLFGFWGTGFVLFSVYLSLPLFIVSLFLQQVNPELEEAGLLHCGWFCVLRRITLPLILPALVFSFLLVFVLTMGEFSVANFLRYQVFPMESFIQFSAFYDFKTATVYTMPLLLIVILLLGMQWTLGSERRGGSQYYRPLLIPLSTRSQVFLFVLLALSLALLIGMPLFGLIQSIDSVSFFSAFSDALPALSRSLIYAFAAATLLVVFGFLSAYVIHYKTGKGWYLLEPLMLFCFLLSSVSLGISLILFWNHSFSNFIYATPLMLLLGYLLKYLYLSTKIISVKFSEIPSAMIESAQITGASWIQILWSIVLPLLRDAVILAWGIGFIFSLRESTLSMLLAPAGAGTLSGYIFTQMANGHEARIASLCLIMVMAILLPLFALLGYRALSNRTKGV